MMGTQVSRVSHGKVFAARKMPAAQKPVMLADLDKDGIGQWLSSFDTIVSDCDGVLWLESTPLEGTAETINRLQELGKTVYFITNNAGRPQSYIVNKAQKLGFDITSERVITPTTATAAYLKKLKFTKKVYVLGRPGMEIELTKQGIRCTDAADDEPVTPHASELTWDKLKLDAEVGAVLVSFDPLFSYGKLTKAANYLRDPECIFLAAGMDDSVPHPCGILVPGFAPTVRSIQTLVPNQEVRVMGKPSRTICDPLLENPTFDAKRTLMIGDSARSDVMLGKNCGFQTALVGSGVHSLEDIERWQSSGIDGDQLLVPDYYLPKLSDLLALL